MSRLLTMMEKMSKTTNSFYPAALCLQPHAGLRAHRTSETLRCVDLLPFRWQSFHKYTHRRILWKRRSRTSSLTLTLPSKGNFESSVDLDVNIFGLIGPHPESLITRWTFFCFMQWHVFKWTNHSCFTHTHTGIWSIKSRQHNKTWPQWQLCFVLKKNICDQNVSCGVWEQTDGKNNTLSHKNKHARARKAFRLRFRSSLSFFVCFYGTLAIL